MRATAVTPWLVLAACSTNGVSGAGSAIVDTISASVTTSDGNGDTDSSAVIAMASVSTLCADAAATPPINREGENFITIELADITDGVSTTPTQPGTFTVYPDTGSQPPLSATVNVGAYDDTCSLVDSGMGQSGSVTLTSINGNVFVGSYDVTLNTGDHLTGTFDPEACPALQQAANSTTGTACD
jgi:hypothetical protein